MLTNIDFEIYDVREDGTIWWLEGRNAGKQVKAHANVGRPQNPRYMVNMKLKSGKFKTFWLHRVIAHVYIPNPENKPEINHIDGNPKNNEVSNLEWNTHKENCEHAQRTGLFVQQRGEKHPSCRLTEQDVEDIRHFRGWGISYPKLGELYGVSTQSVYAIVKRKSWAHV